MSELCRAPRRRSEGYGACADEKQDKGVASASVHTPSTSAGSADSFCGHKSDLLMRGFCRT